mgnify:CR=1
MHNNNITGPKRPFIAKPNTNSDWKVSVEVSDTETREYLIKNCELSNLVHEITKQGKIELNKVVLITKVKG